MINSFKIEALVVCRCSSNATLAKLQSDVFLNYLGFICGADLTYCIAFVLVLCTDASLPPPSVPVGVRIWLRETKVLTHKLV